MVTVRRISNSIQLTEKGWMSFSSTNHNEVAKAFVNLLNKISQQTSCTLIQVTLSEQFSDEPHPLMAAKQIKITADTNPPTNMGSRVR